MCIKENSQKVRGDCIVFSFMKEWTKPMPVHISEKIAAAVVKSSPTIEAIDLVLEQLLEIVFYIFDS